MNTQNVHYCSHKEASTHQVKSKSLNLHLFTITLPIQYHFSSLANPFERAGRISAPTFSPPSDSTVPVRLANMYSEYRQVLGYVYQSFTCSLHRMVNHFVYLRANIYTMNRLISPFLTRAVENPLTRFYKPMWSECYESLHLG